MTSPLALNTLPGRLAALVLALSLAAPSLAAGQDDARLHELELQVQALATQLAALQGELARQRESSSTPASLEQKVDALAAEIQQGRMEPVLGGAKESQWGLAPAASKVYGAGQGVSIGGYGELLYQGFDSSKDDGTPSGAKDNIDLLRAVLYFGYKFNDRFLFNSEIEFEHAHTGQGGEVEVELAYVDFLFRPQVNARAGLLLTPLGFINEIHEPTTFLGARRPEVESRIIPTTWSENGVGLFGEAGPVSWRAYVMAGLDSTGFSAGNGIRGGRQGGSRSLAEDLAVTARVDVKPVPGLMLGVSGWHGGAGQDVVLPGGREIDATVTLWDAHVDWRWRGLFTRALYTEARIGDAELINEANGFTGSDSVGSRLEGWYAHAGWDVLSHLETEQQLIPFARWEEFDTQVSVPAGFLRNPANEVEVLTLGVSYLPHPNVVIKLDWQDRDNAAGTGVDQWNFAVGYIF